MAFWYCIHKMRTLDSFVFSQLNPVQTCFFSSKIGVLLIWCHLYLGLPVGIFSSSFPTKIFSCFFSSQSRATWPALPLTMLHELCQLRNCSLCSFLHSAAPSFQFLIYVLLCILHRELPQCGRSRVRQLAQRGERL